MTTAMILLATILLAVDAPLRETGTFEKVWSAAEPIRLISRQSMRIELPAVPPKGGMQTILALRTRLEADRSNGWNNYLGITINGVAMSAVDAFVQPRLINRPNNYNDAVYKKGQCILSNRINTFFSPSFDRWDFHMDDAVQTRERYWFMLRVGDLLHADRPNVIKLTDTAKFRDFGAKSADQIVVLVDPLQVGYFRPPSVTLKRTAGLDAKTFQPAQTVQRGRLKVEANKLGGLRISYGDEMFVLESAFSYPGPKAKFNLFSGKRGTSQPAWQPAVSRDGEYALVIEAKAGYHRVQRRIELHDGRVDFFDTIENRTDNILPVMALNSLGLGDAQEGIWIGGMPNIGSMPIAAKVDPQNSTVFINAQDRHIGIYAKDTVLRNQFYLDSQPGLITVGTRELGIAKKQSYTLRWRIYLSDSADYFDFINCIRRDDNLNYKIDGPFDFIRYLEFWAYADREKVGKSLTSWRTRIGCGDHWLDYYDGPLNTFNHDRDKLRTLNRKATENLGAAAPQMTLVAGREITFFTAPKDADFSKLPEADSFAKKADGSYEHRGENCPDPNSVYLFAYPALDNTYHQRLMKDVDYLMDECGFAGIYFDIFTLPGAVSYDRWDGHSVDINPKDHTLVRTKNNIPILMGPAQAKMVQKIIDKGGIVVCNQSSTSEELQAKPVLSFVEGTYNVPSTHLWSPIGLCNMWTNFSDKDQKDPATLVDQITQRLKLGGLTYNYCAYLGLNPNETDVFDLMAHCFPITPVQLHAGWIEGEQRIITCIAGRYIWPHADRPTLLVWDASGNRVQIAAPITRTDSAWSIDLNALPPGGVGIIEKHSENQQ